MLNSLKSSMWKPTKWTEKEQIKFLSGWVLGVLFSVIVFVAFWEKLN